MNYEPNSHDENEGPFEDKKNVTKDFPVQGVASRIPFESSDIDFE
jgi:hypothetical protein